LPPQLEPSGQLKDYLYAQGLLEQYQRGAQGTDPLAATHDPINEPPPQEPVAVQANPAGSQLAEIYAEGMKEVFSKQNGKGQAAEPASAKLATNQSGSFKPLDPLKIVYSKLPQAIKNRKFGRPNFYPRAPGPQNQAAPATSR
jgi:hypothetical protein